MIVFRLSRSRYASDLTGKGAKINGGRWNLKGIACLYTSGSRALATLEYTVNVNIEEIPRALSVITLEIPDRGIKELQVEELPGNWKDCPAPSSTKDFGSSLLKGGLATVIKIPSSVIPEEFNYILNPEHPDSTLFKILDIRDFVYDIRIKVNDEFRRVAK